MGYLKSVEHQQLVQAEYLGMLIQIMIAETRFSGKLYVLKPEVLMSFHTKTLSVFITDYWLTVLLTHSETVKHMLNCCKVSIFIKEN